MPSATSATKKLPIKRRKFVEAIIANGGNRTQAAKTAGYAAPWSQGSRLMKYVDVQKAVEERVTSGLAHMKADEIQARLALMSAGVIPTKTTVETGMSVAKDGTAVPVNKRRHEYAMESSTNTLAKIAGLVKDGVPTQSGTTVNILAVLGALDQDKLDRLIEQAQAHD